MTDEHKQKLKLAIAYLRSRNKYLLDGCKWVPTNSGNTNVAATMAAYREEMVWPVLPKREGTAAAGCGAEY